MKWRNFFAGANVQIGLDYLHTTAIYKHLPIMKGYPHIIDRVPEPVLPLQSFGAVIAMFHRLEPAVSIHAWVRGWKCSNKVKHEALGLHEAMAHFQTAGLDRWLVYRLDNNCYKAFSALARMFFDSAITYRDVLAMNELLPIKSKQDLALDGTDIKQLFPGAKGGPWMGKLLDKLEQKVVTGHLSNDKNEIRDWIKWHPHDTS